MRNPRGAWMARCPAPDRAPVPGASPESEPGAARSASLAVAEPWLATSVSAAPTPARASTATSRIRATIRRASRLMGVPRRVVEQPVPAAAMEREVGPPVDGNGQPRA
jgi:hypothetical protein